MFEEEHEALVAEYERQIPLEEQLQEMLWAGEYWYEGKPILQVLGGILIERYRQQVRNESL